MRKRGWTRIVVQEPMYRQVRMFVYLKHRIMCVNKDASKGAKIIRVMTRLLDEQR